MEACTHFPSINVVKQALKLGSKQYKVFLN